MAMAFSENSRPMIDDSRARRPSGPLLSAGRRSTRRPSMSRAKLTASWAMAWRLISSAMAMASERSDFMNFSRAGVA